jgi:hypothetical protein
VKTHYWVVVYSVLYTVYTDETSSTVAHTDNRGEGKGRVVFDHLIQWVV